MVEALLDAITPYSSFLGVLAGAVVVLWGAHRLLLGRRLGLDAERRFPRQLVMLGLSLAAFLAVILALPLGEGSRNRLIAVLGLAASGVIALSSTTVVANFMAGILLRITRPFRIGDYVRVGEHFGRVSERGLFETEIQAESRDLIAFPNTYLISNPVTTVLGSGTIVSTTLSLGFDVHHAQAEPLLVEAARESGLEEPFVQILEIGDHAVTYRVAGFLADTKRLLTARSNLCRAVLDTLHGRGVEILSPTYMNQRRVPGDRKVVPPRMAAPEAAEEAPGAEKIAFDKAEWAAQIDQEKRDLAREIQDFEGALKEVPERLRPMVKERIEQARARLKELAQVRADAPPAEAAPPGAEPAGTGGEPAGT